MCLGSNMLRVWRMNIIVIILIALSGSSLIISPLVKSEPGVLLVLIVEISRFVFLFVVLRILLPGPLLSMMSLVVIIAPVVITSD